jgi:solute:Na+ symporter, SSS family
LFASAIIGFWYWCTDQYIVQRVLSGRNMKEARRGTILAGYFKLLPVFIFLIPGMIAFALNQKGLLHVASSDSAFASMVAQLLPAGVTGVVVCGLLAALMSSLASLFNSSAMLFTEDFYKKFRPGRDEHHYVVVGRIATTTVVILGVLWIPVMLGLGKVLYDYLQGVQGLLAPAIASVFLLGVFWKRATAKGAFWGMITGFGIGMFRLVLNTILGAKVALVVEAEKYTQKIGTMTEAFREQIGNGVSGISGKITEALGATGQQFTSLTDQASSAYQAGKYTEAANLLATAQTGMESTFIGQYGLFYKIAAINPYHFCVILFAICILTIVCISLLTKKPNAQQLEYTFSAKTPEHKLATRASWNGWDIVHTVIILSIVILFYIYFW